MKTGPIGEILETLQEEVEQGVSTAKQQITGKTSGQAQGKPFGGTQGKQGQQAVQTQAQQQSGQKPQQPPTPDQAGAAPSESTPTNQPQDDQTKKFVQDLYGGNTPAVTGAEIEQKKLEDKQKAEALRQKLHREYYERLIKPPRREEERPAEKIEREEEEKKLVLEEEEEKKKKQELPIIVTKDMGTKEKLRGVSG